MGIRDVCWALLVGVVLSGCNNCEGWSIPDAGTSEVSESWASAGSRVSGAPEDVAPVPGEVGVVSGQGRAGLQARAKR
jgi:hypothetical protein